MGKFIDLTGQRFGRLVVSSKAQLVSKDRLVRWYCVCDCGHHGTYPGKSLRSGNTTSCGCFWLEQMARGKRSKSLEKRWKQYSQTKNDKGYLRISRVNEWGVRKELLVHRLVYEEFLGRPLQPWEHIHHRNGIRTDNRLENLELIHAGKHFAGQRPADIVKAKTDDERQRLIADGMALLAAAGVDLSHLSL